MIGDWFPRVNIRLGAGPSFTDTLILGDLQYGILGQNSLGTSVVETVDVSYQTQQISIRHGRDRMFEEYLPGECTVQFLDFDGDWNPANTSSPYYGQIKPMNQLRVYSQYAPGCVVNCPTYWLFSGYIWNYDYQWADASADYAIVTVQAVDAFRLLALANITTVTGAANKDLPGERINLILDEINWPTTARLIDTGDTELENDPGTERTALSALQTIEQSDLGALFIDEEGRIVYYDRNTLSIKATGTATEFDDNGTEIQYQDVDINYDDTELANSVTLTRASGSPQNVFDQNSIDEYFLRSYSRSDLMMETNALALARATQILNYRNQIRLRVDSITLDLSSETDRLEPGLGLSVGDPIIVTKTMAGTSDVTVRVTVQGHTHDITPDRWTTTFTTAYPLSTSFILGSSEFGILGTNTL